MFLTVRFLLFAKLDFGQLEKFAKKVCIIFRIFGPNDLERYLLSIHDFNFKLFKE
jgi:hypothetical protein